MASGPTSRRIGGAGVMSEARVPMFSLSPSEAMQHAAEGLLNPSRLFEVYTDDDGFAFSIETLPHVDLALLELLTETAGSEPQTMHGRRPSASCIS